MNRQIATKSLRDLLDSVKLSDWHIRLITDINKPFLGLCSYKDKTIILNAFHVDSHPEEEIINTIRHEVAHALTRGHSHDTIWRDKARELGCDSFSECASYGLNDDAIDAIRSGATLEVTFDTEVIPEQIIRKPKFTISRLQDKCEVCGRVAKEKSRFEANTSKGRKILITLECGHVLFRDAESQSAFDEIIFDGLASCKHQWGTGQYKTICKLCNARRLYDFQVAGARALEKANGRLAIFDEMGLGKAQPLTALVATPYGFQPMGTLAVGDLVISDDGNAYPITRIYPQGELDVYEVMFSDYSHAICCDNHLWAVNTPIRKYRNQPNLVKPLKEIKNDLFLSSINSAHVRNNKWYIPITQPVNFPEKELPIEPYQLGILLGDGHFGNQVSFHKNSEDKEIIEVFNCTRTENDNYFLDNSYLVRLRDLGLAETRAATKFIPNIYEFSSIEQRLAILQGLMDTDGSIWNNGTVEYTSASSALAGGVIHLVQSLGGICKLSSKKEPKYIYKGETLIGQESFRVVINIPICPFRLKRKADAWQKQACEKKYKPTRAIIRVTSRGKEECQCISVASPNKTYLLEDFIVTHNTIQALAYIRFHQEASPFLWITKSGVKFQHGKEIIRLLGRAAVPQVLQGGKDTLIEGMNCVASYDIFRRLDLEMFIKHGFKCLILDECQAIKNPDSSRTQCIRTIAKHIGKIIPLSGTPWKNRGSEFFVVLNMLDPKRFWSFKSFTDTWVEHYWEGNRLKEGGIRQPKKFKEFIADLAIRRERSEVLPELPLINRTRLISAVPEHARKLYNEEQNNLIKTLNDSAIDGTEDSFNTKQRIMASLMVMRQIVGLAKVPTTIEFAKEFLEETDRKLVIFVHHKKCGELIASQLSQYCTEEELKFKPLVLTAALDSAQRNEIAEQFNSNGNRLLIASTLASGEGLNLQTCSDMIMHERQWNASNEEQAEGRFIRIGQMAQSVNATYVHGDDTIDTILDNIVESKRVAFHNAMNKGELPTWNEASIIKELVEAIRNQNRNKK